MIYDTRIHNNKKANEGKNMVRKNYKNFNNKEKKYLKNMIDNIDIDNINITNHAIRKNLLNVNTIKNILKNDRYDIIDYNFFIDNKEERILLRTKNVYDVKNTNNKVEVCYIKIVISITNNTIITTWANKVEDEEKKQESLCNNYYEKFDIINKKIAI